ncbi:MAG: molybdenum ABC transporter ATP-binding protein [Vicinamibacterales bacterium]
MTLHASILVRLSDQFALGISIDAPPGITIVFGASGSGKSTMLRAIAGLQPLDGGRIILGARTIADVDAGVSVPAQHRRVGLVSQALALFPHLSVRGNVEYGLHGMPRAERDDRVRDIATRFRIDHLLDRRPTAISGGERQRTALARAVVTEPEALLLDEPLSALDFATQSHIIEDLQEWNAARRVPVLYVTHSHREAFALGQRVVVLDRGRVLASGTPHEVIDLPAQETIARLVGFENLFTARVLARREVYGVMVCGIEGAGVDLEVPIGVAQPDARVRIAISAGDILLAVQRPDGLSARNVIPGVLTAMAAEGARTSATIDAGVPFVVHLTRGAVESLALEVGTRVWLVIKTHSCRLVSL